jgi:hypothetical protein
MIPKIDPKAVPIDPHRIANFLLAAVVMFGHGVLIRHFILPPGR